MTSLATLLILSLVAWRISRIIVAEDGPFDVFAKLRARLGVPKQETWIQRGFACLACVSLWVSLVVVLPWSSSVWAWLVQSLAASAVCVILMRKVA